jgi:hypothetical protein
MHDDTHKAQQLADLMPELDAYIWQGVVYVTQDPKGPKIILKRNDNGRNAWTYVK